VTTASPPDPGIRGVAAGAIFCACAAVTVVVLASATVSLAALADDARKTLRFGFGGVEQSPSEVARLAIHNARFAGGTLLCAGLAPRLKKPARRAVDLLLAGLLTFNAVAVGIAIGAYGTRAITATATHLPVEFGALSLAGGAYMQACKQPLSARALAAVAAATALLLVTAAMLETYGSIGATQ
jgi:hypothetical protein